nr:hypothetical protein [Tanacetum cinerariifolium]
MPSLFADTHNVVAMLEKSDASEGFAQIIDFLSGSYINYALTVSPHIYISGVVCLPNEEIFSGLAQMGYEKPVGKGCSGVETPLFENMLQVREVDTEEEVQVPAHDDVDQANVTEEIADDVAQP